MGSGFRDSGILGHVLSGPGSLCQQHARKSLLPQQKDSCNTVGLGFRVFPSGSEYLLPVLYMGHQAPNPKP